MTAGVQGTPRLFRHAWFLTTNTRDTYACKYYIHINIYKHIYM